jgi:hypothetical protein
MDPVSTEVEGPNNLLLTRLPDQGKHVPKKRRRRKDEEPEKAIPLQGYVTEILLKPINGGKGRYVSSSSEAAFCWDPGLRAFFSDGPQHLKELFDTIGITIKHLELWFTKLEKMTEPQAAALIGLIRCGALNPKIATSLITALGMIEIGAIRAFQGNALDLAQRLLDEGQLTEEELIRHFNYESYGSELMRTLDRKDIGDLDDRELGESWVEELYSGIGNVSPDLRRQHFGVQSFSEEISRRVIEFTVDGRPWLIEKTLT